MELYKLGSLFLDISLGLITIGVLTRLVMSMIYIKRNGEKTITKEQGKKMAKIVLPFTLTGLLLALASITLLLITR